MWTEFALAFIFGFFSIYSLGFLFLKTIRFATFFSLLFAPIASISFFALLTSLYSFLHIPCNNFSVLFLPLLILGITFLLTHKFLEDKTPIAAITFGTNNLLMLCFYIFVGLLLCVIFFIKSLDGANSFYNGYDNITHINLVQAFVNSDVWSTFSTSNYLASPVSPKIYSGLFYPSGWHYIVAIAVQTLKIPIPIAINAINSVFIGLIYPSSVFFLLYSLFEKDQTSVMLGPIVMLGFTAFPWALILKGPLYPNLASLCLMPLTIACFVIFIKESIWKTNKIRFLAIAIMSLISLAISQPNTFFTSLVFIFFFLLSHINRHQFNNYLSKRRRVIYSICLILAVLAIWIICFKLPFIQSVVTYHRDSDLSFIDALFCTVSLSFSASIPQTILAALIPFGIIYLISKKMTWILFPALYMATTYIECRCGSDGLKQLLAGFWYSDPTRIAANLAIFLIPIVAAGLRLIISILQTMVKQALNTLRLELPNRLIPIVFVVLFSSINYYPNFIYPKSDQTVQTAFGIIQQQIEKRFNTKSEQVYSLSERQFVEKALKIVSEEALIINQPNDGSAFAYGINNANTYYRLISLSNETTDSLTIRTKLSSYSTDKTVQQSVSNINAKYVLLLDKNKEWERMPKAANSPDAQPENWIGIDSIDDSTPGFKVVLAEGDMRLYEIEPL